MLRLFDQPWIAIVCPECGYFKKCGNWIKISEEEIERINGSAKKIKEIHETCPACESELAEEKIFA